ncbi:MAG: NAD-dependent epimerase/dehydratase family protein [candidate division WOR-3 bacterium]
MGLTSKLILVTGASGHLGNNVVRCLIEKGYRVRALVRSYSRSLDGVSCEIVRGDVLDVDTLKNAFDGVSYVIHCAAQISIAGNLRGEVYKINVMGTKNVLQVAKKNNVEKLVYVGSIHAFKDNGGLVNESSEIVDHDGSPYDMSKAEALRIVKAEAMEGLNVCAVCPTALIGPYDFKPSFIGRFLISLSKGKVPALVEGGFDWVDVRDVASGVVNALDKGRPGDLFILSGEYLRVRELAEIWGEVSNLPIPKIVFPLNLAILGATAVEVVSRFTGNSPIFTREAIRALKWRSKISRERAETQLGYRPRPLRETLKDTYKWFKEYGYI